MKILKIFLSIALIVVFSLSIQFITGVNWIPLAGVIASLSVLNYLVNSEMPFFTSSFGALTTGAGVVTTFNLDNGVPQFCQIGTLDTALPITKFELSVSGKSYQNIPTQVLCQAYSAYLMEGLLGADVIVGQTIIMADGFIAGKNCQVNITNAGVTTPNVYFNSIRKGVAPVVTGTEVIQNNASLLFSGFEALFFVNTNLDYADILFIDGHKDKFSGPELSSLFARQNETDANGLLSAQTVIDNQFANIVSVELYASGGTITVLQVA